MLVQICVLFKESACYDLPVLVTSHRSYSLINFNVCFQLLGHLQISRLCIQLIFQYIMGCKNLREEFRLRNFKFWHWSRNDFASSPVSWEIVIAKFYPIAKLICDVLLFVIILWNSSSRFTEDIWCYSCNRF